MAKNCNAWTCTTEETHAALLYDKLQKDGTLNGLTVKEVVGC